MGRENGWEIGAAPWRAFDHPDDFAVGGADVALAAPTQPAQFWGRGNGWAVAGLAQVLAKRPTSDDHRAPLMDLYEQTLEFPMAKRSVDGLVPSDLHHPEAGGETSTSAPLMFAATHLLSWKPLRSRGGAAAELKGAQLPAVAPGPTVSISRHRFVAAGAVLLAGEELQLSSDPSPALGPQPC